MCIELPQKATEVIVMRLVRKIKLPSNIVKINLVKRKKNIVTKI